jgi:predicted acyl esterase
MRDGVKLFTSVYVPISAGAAKNYPVLMVRTPYSDAPYDLDRYWLGKSYFKTREKSQRRLACTADKEAVRIPR